MSSIVFFFDIGDTLATPVFDGDNLRFIVLPGAREALVSLWERNIRTGVISHAGDDPQAAERANAALRDCGLFDFFERALLVYRKKDSPAAFIFAATQAGVPPDQCIFVGENSQERSFALQAGFLHVAPTLRRLRCSQLRQLTNQREGRVGKTFLFTSIWLLRG